MLSDEHLDLLRAIPPGGPAPDVGVSEDELQSRFLDRMHQVRQLAAEGYLGVLEVREEAGPPSRAERVFYRTRKGEQALRDAGA